MAVKIGLIDYGMGNLFSVQQAFARLKTPLKLIQNPEDFHGCDALILPGVGSFDPAIERLRQKNIIPYLESWNKEKKPLLGICLGLQLLFESSDEGISKGLGFIEGHVHRLPKIPSERIPHMGWSLIESKNICPLIQQQPEHSEWVYFVHSYAATPTKGRDLAAVTQFGEFEITAIVWKDRLGACQFHPEKSGKTGQKMLKNWINWLENGAQI